MSRDDLRDHVGDMIAALQRAREFTGGMTLAEFAGMRNKLIHDYVAVNEEVVWRTVTQEIPPVLAALALGARSRPPDMNS